VGDHLSVVVQFCGIWCVVGFGLGAGSTIATARSWGGRRGRSGGGRGWIRDTLGGLAIRRAAVAAGGTCRGWRRGWVGERSIVEIVSLLAIHVEGLRGLLILGVHNVGVGLVEVLVGLVVKGRMCPDP
jgi:hypothetical protein